MWYQRWELLTLLLFIAEPLGTPSDAQVVISKATAGAALIQQLHIQLI